MASWHVVPRHYDVVRRGEPTFRVLFFRGSFGTRHCILPSVMSSCLGCYGELDFPPFAWALLGSCLWVMWALVPSLEFLAAIFPRREVFFACAGHYCVCVRLQKVGRPDEVLHGRQDGEIHFRLGTRWYWQGVLSQLPPRGRILERHPDGVIRLLYGKLSGALRSRYCVSRLLFGFSECKFLRPRFEPP